MESSSNNEHTIEPYSAGGIYLRMDGSGISTFMPDGGGTVNCQVKAGPWEKFKLEKQSDGFYTIESIAFPGVFLRLDGRGVDESCLIGGTVNCQFGAKAWEKFKIEVPHASFGYSIESAAFPGVYLRMDYDTCEKNSGPGCGTINCRWGANSKPPLREWYIIRPFVQPNS